MGYSVESEGTVFIERMVLTILITTVLEKGVVNEFPLVKTGGFSEDDADADFWRTFYSEEKIVFPEGKYELAFSTGFYINTGTDYQASLHYNFEVR